MRTKHSLLFKKYYLKVLAGILLFSFYSCNEQKNEPLQLNYENDISVTYYQAIKFYQELDNNYKTAKLFSCGLTDIGKPLHLFVISKKQIFDPEKIRNKNMRIILINNGIHPGESCGIEASLLFADDILRNKNDLSKYLDNTVICIIPVYNIGGALNRSVYHRINQNGPKEKGNRGNGKNLDLNRDFIKNDTENAKSFAKIFQNWQPDVFLDTHTTNGSDHQYTITLINTQHNKLHPVLGEFLNETMVPSLFQKMEKGAYEMTPYVNTMFGSPDRGIAGFLETGRYSSGYAALFNTLSFMTENHSYKPFKDRVLSAYNFITALTEFTSENAVKIAEIRKKANETIKTQEKFPLSWTIDTSRYDIINFKGYYRNTERDPNTGRQSRFYDREDPFEKEIPYYKYYKAVEVVQKPEMYIIPQAWQGVIERLKINGVRINTLSEDTTLTVEAYYIENYQTSTRINNGHFIHNNIQTRSTIQEVKFYKGDYVIPVNQEKNRYIVETLEPKGSDSFFRYNFFDSVLGGWGSYMMRYFERQAREYLEENSDLKMKFEKRTNEEPSFADDQDAQLKFIFENSPYFDKTSNRYPVYRFNEKTSPEVN